MSEGAGQGPTERRTGRPGAGPRGAGRLVLELVGPAGSGKTTVADALRGAGPPEPGAASGVGVEAAHGARLAALGRVTPVLAAARVSGRGRWWTAGELRGIAALEAWRRPLREAASGTGGAVVLDHGPVFRLAALAAYGPPMSRTAPFCAWWERTALAWADLLDGVVWLDADDAVLQARIDSRDRSHRIRGAGQPDAAEFLARYRQAYRAAVTALADAGTPVVHLDTTTLAPEQVVAAVRTGLGLASPGQPR